MKGKLTMTTRKFLGSMLLAVAMVASSEWVSAGTATPETILVIPARQRMVKLAFDISRCKEVGLVTYNNSPTLSTPLIHAWNGQEWIQISMDDYVEGRFMSGDPKHVFLFGDGSTLPLKMMDGPTWYKDLNRITTLDLATIINQVGNVLHFSSRQWKWMAETYGLKIEDTSTERRRYGRWGAPGKEKDLEPNTLETTILPPAPMVADPIVKKTDPVLPVLVEKPSVTIEPVKAEVPVIPKADAPVVTEKHVVPMTVTVKPEPAKVEVKVEEPQVEPPAPVAPVTAPAAPITK